jgi:hypothetical protein
METLQAFLATGGGQNLLFSLFSLFLFLRMLRRAGLPRAWALLALVPQIGPMLVFAVMALKRWPNARPTSPVGSVATP